jgi:sugar O-acyltransferase (sialic acid O-acetyltransferase NeuD family)
MNIIGASGHAKAVIDILPDIKAVKAIYDDFPKTNELMGIPVMSSEEMNWSKPRAGIIAVGNNKQRMDLAARLKSQLEFVNIFHKTAIISNFVEVSHGIVVMEGAIIKVHTFLGAHVIVNTAATVDHDCWIGDYVHLAPRVTLCGNVHIGKGSLIGAGSVVLPGIKIGEWAIVGAGSTVHKDVPSGSKWIGKKLV